MLRVRLACLHGVFSTDREVSQRFVEEAANLRYMPGERLVIYIGIDPGVSGGIAVLDQHGDDIDVRATAMPDTQQGVWDFITSIPLHQCATAVVEQVHSSPQMGVVSAFTFGRQVERVQMALTARAIPFTEARPQKWQPVMGVVYPRAPKGPDGKRAFTPKDKNISKARAQELFPGLTVTHAIADALLIADFCRRVRQHGEETEGAADEGQSEEGNNRRPAGDGGHGVSARRVRRPRLRQGT